MVEQHTVGAKRDGGLVLDLDALDFRERHGLTEPTVLVFDGVAEVGAVDVEPADLIGLSSPHGNTFECENHFFSLKFKV